MDCSAEEQLIRFLLEPVPGVQNLLFNLPEWKLVVIHSDIRDQIKAKLATLNLGTIQILREEEETTGIESFATNEKSPLIAAFSINATLFLAELSVGLLAYSMGLVADSLDMLADALVYGMAFAAVGGSAVRKKSIARTMGYFQVFLACAGIFEVLRRFLFGENLPDALAMVAVSCIALAGNIATLLILNRNRDSGVHMKAAWVCTSVDVQVNALMIATGVLVHFVPSRVPDLVVGGLIFLIVASGARKILALAD